jgi:Glycosyl transferase family 2
VTAPPTVSIVIATYDWSAALRYAIRSVLAQTFADFELLVVGDACTDDSAEVVAAVADARVRWHNLAANHGGQWGPNNFGLRAARGEWTAYLGHDDLWYPTHLETALRTARETSADMVAAVTILYGPPGSGIRGLTGVFVDDRYSPDDFVPPSSLLHRRSLAGGAGAWKDPATLALPVDWEFVRAAAAAGARIAPTNELTVFKFNAAWRRDSYRRKDTAEQEAMLSRMAGGSDFRPLELMSVLQAVIANRFVHDVAPPRAMTMPGATARHNRRVKGVEASYEGSELRRVDRSERFPPTERPGAFEWHDEEMDPEGRAFRWSGPVTRSRIEVPVWADRPLAVTVHVLSALRDDVVHTATLAMDGRTLPTTRTREDDGTYRLRAVVPAAAGAAPLGFDLVVATVQRPCDLGQSADRRWLGLAVSGVDVAPVDEAMISPI